MSDKRVWSTKQIVVVIVVAAVSGYVLGRLSTELRINFDGCGGRGGGEGTDAFVLDDPGPIAQDADALPVADAPFLGPGAAKVTIVEFSDFQCPFCQRASPVVHALMERYEGDLRFVFMNLPLPMHPEAEPAARAALAAHRQGAFWAYHDLLFENQRLLGGDSYEDFAEELDLDLEQFRRDFADEALAERVTGDLELGRRLGINGTPTFLVNGIQVVGAQPPEAFGRIIDAEIEAADALLDDGVPLTEIHRRRVQENLGDPGDAGDAGEQGSARPGQWEGRPPARPDVPAPVVQPVAIPEGRATLTVYADVTDRGYLTLGQNLEALMATYGDQLEVRYVSFVDPADPDAVLAGAALSEAHSMGTFRQLHELLIESQDTLDRARIDALTRQAGLDVEALSAALDSGELVRDASERRAEAQNQGVVMAPTVRVGELRLVGPVPYEDLRVAVNASMVAE